MSARARKLIPILLAGASVLATGGSNASGGSFDFSNFNFRTTVPTTQTRTFLGAHVYAGAPKITLKGDGNLGWNNHNILASSEIWSAWAASANTTRTDNFAVAPNGTLTANRMYPTTTGSNRYAAQSMSGRFVTGAQYTLSCYAQAAGLNFLYLIGLDGSTTTWFDLANGTIGTTAGAHVAAIENVGSGWYRCSITHTSASGVQAYIGLSDANNSYVATTNGTNGVNVWGGQVNYGSLLPYLWNPLTSATRLDEPTVFNTSGTRLGIVLEPAATNSLRESQRFNTSPWSIAAGTVTENAAVAPDGTTTANRISGWSTVDGDLGPTNSSTVSVGTYTGSLWVKGEGSDIGKTMNVRLKRVTGVFVSVDLVVTLTANWERVQTSLVMDPSNTGIQMILTGAAASGTKAAGCLAWGAQLEAGSSATSYIPTTTASVTRTADSCYRVLGPELTSRSSGYSVFAKWSNAQNTGARIIDLNSATLIRLSGGVIKLNANGMENSGGAALSSGRGAISVGSSGPAVLFSANGVTYSNTGVYAATTVSTVYFGSTSSGTNHLNGVLEQVSFWQSELTQVQLDALTLDGTNPSSPNLDFNYATGVYQYTPVNAGVTTSYTLSTLISSGLMTLTGTPSAKWVRGSNGLLQQVTAGELAIEYDTSGNVLGCINTEPARTNFNTRSADQTNAAWTKTGATASAAGVGPYNNTMTTLTEDTATSLHRAYSTGWSGTGGTIYTISAWLRAGTRRYVAIGFSEGVNAVFVTIDTQTWTISQQATAVGSSSALSNSGKIEDWGGGLYRVSVSGNHVGTNLYYSIVAGANTGTPTDPLLGNTYLGTSSTIICSDFQAEAGTYASSYIPTTSASVTRNADVWTLNLGSWFDNSRWIVASKFYAPRANMTDGSVTPAIWSLNIATPSANNYAATWVQSTNRIDVLERTNSTNGGSGNTTSLSYPATIKSAFGWSPDNVKASLNGATLTTAGTPSSSATQQAFVTLRFGDSERSNADQGSVYIQSLNIFPVVPTQENVNQYAGAA